MHPLILQLESQQHSVKISEEWNALGFFRKHGAGSPKEVIRLVIDRLKRNRECCEDHSEIEIEDIEFYR